MERHDKLTTSDVARYQQNYLVEMDSITLYRSLARAEKDRERAAIFERMARIEERHAQRWARLLQQAGAAVPTYRLSLRVRAAILSRARTERWPSGRRRSPAKGVYGLKLVSRVRIPLSPPTLHFIASGCTQ